MTQRVLLLLADGFDLFDVFGFLDVQGWATFDSKDPMELTKAANHPTFRATRGLCVNRGAQVPAMMHILPAP